MQSWGVQSNFHVRDTQREPTKSGVLGLIGGALGRSRKAPLQDLASLRMGVRVDKPGILKYEFQTASNVLSANRQFLHEHVLSQSHYLADACFLVGLEGSKGLLQLVQEALGAPRYLPYLGRKSFVPSPAVYLPDGLQETALEKALVDYPFLPSTVSSGHKPPLECTYTLEVPDSSQLRHDQPVGCWADRSFTWRPVVTTRCRPGEPLCI